MRTAKFSVWILAVGALVVPGAATAQDRYYNRQDLRSDYRDVQRDYAQLDRLRADVARDQYRLNEARRYGDHFSARQISADLRRDKHALKALEHDIRHDIRRDQRDLYRDGYYR